VGFRTTRVSGGHLLHNDKPLLLRGVNRHEWHERWGEFGNLDELLNQTQLDSCCVSPCNNVQHCCMMHGSADMVIACCVVALTSTIIAVSAKTLHVIWL
jgi:hypothetical protein